MNQGSLNENLGEASTGMLQCARKIANLPAITGLLVKTEKHACRATQPACMVVCTVCTKKTVADVMSTLFAIFLILTKQKATVIDGLAASAFAEARTSRASPGNN